MGKTVEVPYAELAHDLADAIAIDLGLLGCIDEEYDLQVEEAKTEETKTEETKAKRRG